MLRIILEIWYEQRAIGEHMRKTWATLHVSIMLQLNGNFRFGNFASKFI